MRCVSRRGAAFSRILSAILGAASFLPPTADAEVIYSNSPTLLGSGANAYTSATDAGASIRQVLDDFQLSNGATVTGVTWQGAYLNVGGNGSPNTTDWYVAIYESNQSGGITFPFVRLYDEEIASSAVTETLAGTTILNSANVNYFNDSTSLPTPISLAADQPYFLSVFSYNNGPSGDLWSWLSGGAASSVSFQYNGSSTPPVNGDRAFSLTGTTVPEPAYVAPLVLLAFANRRRSHR